MISLFNIAPQDQSMLYLSQLFGYVGNVLPSTSSTIFGAMFKTLNTTALVLGSILVVQTTVMGLLKSAQEGEMLGKQWSSLWLPLRTVIGIASLFPTTSGYSILQVAMMWFIVQGIGAADTLWNTVLNYISAMGSPYAGMSAPTMGIEASMRALSQGLVCQAEAYRSDPDQIQNGSTSTLPYYYYCGDPANSSSNFCQIRAQDLLNITNSNSPQYQEANGGYITYLMGPNGACGQLLFADPKTYIDPKGTTPTTPVCSNTDPASVVTCTGITAQVPILQTIVTSLGTLATSIAEYDHQYLQFYNLNMIVAPSNIPAFIGNFCAANNIPKYACCVYNNTDSKLPVLCQDTTDGSIPSAYGDNNDYTNVSQSAAKGIYWIYAIQPGLGNAPDVIGTNTTYYASTIVAALTKAELAQPENLQNWESDAQSTGWLLAGAYYYRIASISNSGQSAALPPMGVTGVDPYVAVAPQSTAMKAYRNNYEGMGHILDAITNSTSNALTSSAPPVTQAANNTLQSGANGIINNFQRELTGSANGTGNPLVAVQSFGESLLISAQVIFPVFLYYATPVLIISSLNFMALGFGPTVAFWAAAIKFLVTAALSIVVLFCGWCITFGGMLAIYTPLVPYIIFTFGAIGWFTAAIEAMVAAPFVALGILSPNGQHELLGKAEPAVMIMLNTFLRPTLMILGMMAGMILAPIVVSMINNGFNAVVGSIYGNKGLGPVELIIFITSYSTLIITSMNKCFALVYIIPEKVLTWVGGHAISYGESESLQAVKKSTEAAADTVKSSMDTASSLVQKGASKVGQAAIQKDQKTGEVVASQFAVDIAEQTARAFGATKIAKPKGDPDNPDISTKDDKDDDDSGGSSKKATPRKRPSGSNVSNQPSNDKPNDSSNDDNDDGNYRS